LNKVYPNGHHALKDVSMEINSGMFGLLGPNGSGKTTLMRILAGLIEPSTGSITMNGMDIISRPKEIWRRLGYLPQDFGFYPHLTGEAVLLHLLRLKGVESPKGLKYLAAQLLERVNLSAAAKRKVKTYSGGMKQRLGIAQAIAGNPELVIVDEPTAGLDPEERMRFYHLLSEMAEDRTVLLTTHIVEDVSVLCAQFAVIRKGVLLATTSPGEACAGLQGALYEGVVARDQMEMLTERGVVTRRYLVEGQQRVRIYVNAGSPPADFELVEPTLEDAYMLMQHSQSMEDQKDEVTQ
jgi:ABC-type multidrug transport system ATPase subunit